MRLSTNDVVTTADIVHGDYDALIVTAHGYAKRTPLVEFPTRQRPSVGVRALSRDALTKTGPIVGLCVVDEQDEIALISVEGMVLRVPVAQIARQGRNARGTLVMRLREGDTVAAVALLRSQNGTGTL
jgi:DNA gyrase subunit A